MNVLPTVNNGDYLVPSEVTSKRVMMGKFRHKNQDKMERISLERRKTKGFEFILRLL
jgi:hypothetical protein